ncbi:hypothetical protein TcG_05342 [Trypanosoma cruzi]|nr:hypothetical protein TcG_05342 [Trypanosoma cruzi]
MWDFKKKKAVLPVVHARKSSQYHGNTKSDKKISFYSLQHKITINGSRGPTNTHTALQRPTQMPRPTVRRDTALALGHFNWDGPASVKAWHPTQQALSGAAAEKRGKGGSEEAPIMRMLFCISLRARCTRRWRTSTSSR